MYKHLDIKKTKINNLNIIKRNPIQDDRGFLSRVFCSSELDMLLNGKKIHQINHTLTKEIYSIRGMHFQFPPHSEIKIVSCFKGKVLDVAIDLRKNSETFLSYHAEILSDKNYKSLFIPEGFAHGFQTLEENCELIYLHTEKYRNSSEGGIKYDEPKVKIDWPKKVSNLSQRDLSHPYLNDDFLGI